MTMTSQLAKMIIGEIANGNMLRKTLDKHGVVPSTFFEYLHENPSLADLYGRAQKSRAELLVEEIVEITDTEQDPNKARVRADARKWYASKMQPQKYGDRIDLNVNQTVDIGSALAEAKKRALPQSLERDVTPTTSEDDDIFK